MNSAANMNSADAIATVIAAAASYAENFEEAFVKRIDATTTDDECAAIAKASLYETEEVLEIRDLWNAINILTMIANQRGCEHYGPDAGEGQLTTLIDTIVFG